MPTSTPLLIPKGGRHYASQPAFKAWFGDSLAIVKSGPDRGQPQVMFHGTKSSFSQFSLRKAGTSDPGLAGPAFYFTHDPSDASSYALKECFGEGAHANVIPAFIAIRNPLVIQHGILPDGRRLLDLHEGLTISREGGLAVRKTADDAGHDGVAWVNDTGEVLHAAVFHPAQIKSATGNCGSFDPNDPNICH